MSPLIIVVSLHHCYHTISKHTTQIIATLYVASLTHLYTQCDQYIEIQFAPAMMHRSHFRKRL